jgi:hypothetical protein
VYVCVTYLLQASSGDSTCYFDPSGQALAQTVREMRQQAPRGRSVTHTQPDLGQRFAHEWEPWSACSTERTAVVGHPPPSSSSDRSGGGSSRQAAHVTEALYLRLPLRLQDQKLQGSAIAAAAGAKLGLAGRVAGLTLEDVRQQVSQPLPRSPLPPRSVSAAAHAAPQHLLKVALQGTALYVCQQCVCQPVWLGNNRESQSAVLRASAGRGRCLPLTTSACRHSLSVLPQVAAFGPTGARSLLFLGHIQALSVSAWPTDGPGPVKAWQAYLATRPTPSGSSLRVGECATLLGA